MKALAIGDPVEVRFWTLRDKEKAEVLWRPATVVNLQPLAVAFADGERYAIHDRKLQVRRAER